MILSDTTSSQREPKEVVWETKVKDPKCLILLTLSQKKPQKQTEISEEDRDEWLDCKRNW